LGKCRIGVSYRLNTVLDHIDIAVLTRVNELAGLYGLKPYDFIATVKDTERTMVLAYEIPASGARDIEKRYSDMLRAIGVGETSMLEGTEREIIDALDNAIARAPKPRTRR
jgi:hypothetical protein